MDLGQLISVLRLSWDLPWRLGASVAALATLGGIWTGSSALQALADLGDSAGTPTVAAAALRDSHVWLSHHSILGLAGIALELIGLTFSGHQPRSGQGTRAPATALLGIALAVECGWVLAAMIIGGVALLLWFLALTYRLVLEARNGFDDHALRIEAWLRRTCAAPLVAALYIPLAPISWATRA
ncbi:MAG: hypothetical protein J0G30_04260 [Actinomycetales bacterium]|nr:hypothetical protein [Actinomycetales bacterium]